MNGKKEKVNEKNAKIENLLKGQKQNTSDIVFQSIGYWHHLKIEAEMAGKGTTEIGYVNKNCQKVIKNTGLPGSDHQQKIYILKCLKLRCEHEYGSNGSDIHERKCPKCQDGAIGESH